MKLTDRINKSWKSLLLIGVGIGIIGLSAYLANRDQKEFEKQLLAQISSRQEVVVDAASKNVMGILEHSSHDLLFLTEQFKHAHSDDELEEIVLNFSRINPEHYQVRFLDEFGKEVIRVNHEQGEAPELVPLQDLQDKSNRYYFKESIILGDGKVYVSPLDLNVENKEIETPYRPMIRFFTPLYVDGKVKGVVGLNLNARYFLDNLIDSNIFLLNTNNEVFSGTSFELYQQLNYRPKEGSFIDQESGDLMTSISFSLWNNKWVIGNKTDLSEFYNQSKDHQNTLYMIVGALLVTYCWGIGLYYRSEKKRAKLESEEKLKESEESLKKAQEIGKIGSWNWDAKTDTGKWSDQTYQILGFKPGEINVTFEFLLKQMHSDDRERIAKEIEKAVSTQKPLDMEYRIFKKDGSLCVVHSVSEVMVDETGKTTGMVGILQDITEQKKVEQALKESEEKYRTIFDNVGEEIVFIDNEGKILEVNGRIEDIFGYKPEDVIGKNFMELGFFIPEEMSRIMKLYQDAITKGPQGNLELKAQNKAGEEIFIEVSTKLVEENNKVSGMVNIIRDITERKQAEKTLNALVKSTAETTGKDLFDNITKSLCDLLYVDLALVSKFTSDGKNAKALSMYFNGEFVPDYKYELKGTPCAHVADKGYCVYPENVAKLFPDDKDLIDLKAEGYVGIPLKNKNGKAVGVLCAISRNKLDLPPKTEEVMNIIAARAAAEIEREREEKEKEKALYDLSERFKELEGLYALGKLTEAIDDLEVILNTFVNDIIPPSMQFPDKTYGIIELDEKIYSTKDCELDNLVVNLNSPILVQGKQRGNFYVGYSEKLPFLEEQNEEQNLINGYAERLGEIIERFEAEEEKEKALYNLGGRVKELNGLYSLGRLADKVKDLNVLCYRLTKEIIPPSMQFPDKTIAIIELDDQKYCNCNDEYGLDDMVVKLSSKIWVKGKQRGKFYVGYSEDLPFLEEKNEEQNLIDGYVNRLGKIIERFESERELFESEEKFKTLAESSPVGVYMTDKDGECIYTNPLWQEMAGMNLEESLGQGWMNALHPDDKEMVQKEWYKSVKSGGKWGFEYRFQNKEGKTTWIFGTANAVKDNHGDIIKYIGSNVDITENKKAQQLLEESEENYRNLVENAQLLVWTCDTKGRFTFLNPACETIHGYTAEEMLGRPFTDFQTEEVAERDRKEFARHMVGGKVTDYETIHISKSGEEINLLFSAEPMFASDGKTIIGTQGTAYDITAIRKTQQSLKESEEKYRSLFEHSNDAVFLHDLEGKILDVNEKTCEMLNYNKNKIKEMYIAELHPEEELPKCKKAFEETIKTGSTRFESRFKKEDASLIDVDISSRITNKEKGIIQGIVRDITERKQYEKQIKKALEEKDVLLKEIHHRVKNNLQIVSSLLYLQSESIENEQALNALKDSQNRISTMAKIHEQLYRSENMARINFGDFIENITSDLYSSYGVDAYLIKTKTDIDKMSFEIDYMIPCGLIVNELMSNSLKYAFPENKEGEIKISLKEKDQNIELIVGDNGVGLPKDLNIEETDSLGLKLIRLLTEQIEGKLEIDRENGTEYRITFAKRRHKKIGGH